MFDSSELKFRKILQFVRIKIQKNFIIPLVTIVTIGNGMMVRELFESSELKFRKIL
jgi:hypothetical protein